MLKSGPHKKRIICPECKGYKIIPLGAEVNNEIVDCICGLCGGEGVVDRIISVEYQKIK